MNRDKAQVYVRPFPLGGALTKISSDGGEAPRWRGDGKELYYLKRFGNFLLVNRGFRAITFGWAAHSRSA